MLCRAVRASTFLSVIGKYSVRWSVMSSLGGRCPKKLWSFPGRFLPLVSGGVGGPDSAGLCRPSMDVGEGGSSSARSGSWTPKPLRMLIELARLVALLVARNLPRGGEELPASSPRRNRPVRRRVSPCSRVGWSGGAWQMDISSASVSGSPGPSSWPKSRYMPQPSTLRPPLSVNWTSGPSDPGPRMPPLPNFLRTFSRTSMPPAHEPTSTVKERPSSGSKKRTSLRRRSAKDGVTAP
ncbi:hypothetical protein C8R44DRAFT_802452 [Mycena epipterygia]|nr:hypothetical protein C8R44DRAFT_802452 [Mycena epipterygia]